MLQKQDQHVIAKAMTAAAAISAAGGGFANAATVKGRVNAASGSFAAKVVDVSTFPSPALGFAAEIAIAITIACAIAIEIVRTGKMAIAVATNVADTNPMSSGGKNVVGIFSAVAAANTMNAAARLLLPKVWLCSRGCFSFVFGNALAAKTVSAIVFAIAVAADIAAAVKFGIKAESATAKTVVEAVGIIIDRACTFVSSIFLSAIGIVASFAAAVTVGSEIASVDSEVRDGLRSQMFLRL